MSVTFRPELSESSNSNLNAIGDANMNHTEKVITYDGTKYTEVNVTLSEPVSYEDLETYLDTKIGNVPFRVGSQITLNGQTFSHNSHEETFHLPPFIWQKPEHQEATFTLCYNFNRRRDAYLRVHLTGLLNAYRSDAFAGVIMEHTGAMEYCELSDRIEELPEDATHKQLQNAHNEHIRKIRESNYKDILSGEITMTDTETGKVVTAENYYSHKGRMSISYNPQKDNDSDDDWNTGVPATRDPKNSGVVQEAPKVDRAKMDEQFQESIRFIGEIGKLTSVKYQEFRTGVADIKLNEDWVTAQIFDKKSNKNFTERVMGIQSSAFEGMRFYSKPLKLQGGQTIGISKTGNHIYVSENGQMSANLEPSPARDKAAFYWLFTERPHHAPDNGVSMCFTVEQEDIFFQALQDKENPMKEARLSDLFIYEEDEQEEYGRTLEGDELYMFTADNIEVLGGGKVLEKHENASVRADKDDAQLMNVSYLIKRMPHLSTKQAEMVQEMLDTVSGQDNTQKGLWINRLRGTGDWLVTDFEDKEFVDSNRLNYKEEADKINGKEAFMILKELSDGLSTDRIIEDSLTEEDTVIEENPHGDMTAFEKRMHAMGEIREILGFERLGFEHNESELLLAAAEKYGLKNELYELMRDDDMFTDVYGHEVSPNIAVESNKGYLADRDRYVRENLIKSTLETADITFADAEQVYEDLPTAPSFGYHPVSENDWEDVSFKRVESERKLWIDCGYNWNKSKYAFKPVLHCPVDLTDTSRKRHSWGEILEETVVNYKRDYYLVRDK